MNLIQLALRRPYTFIVMAILIVLATPLLLKMSMDILPEINIPVISITVWNYTGMSACSMASASPPRTSAA